MSSLRDINFSKYRRFSQTLQTTWIVSKNSDLVKTTLKNSEIILYTQAYLRFLYGLLSYHHSKTQFCWTS
jgi:hypothetical protein